MYSYVTLISLVCTRISHVCVFVMVLPVRADTVSFIIKIFKIQYKLITINKAEGRNILIFLALTCKIFVGIGNSDGKNSNGN